MTNDQLEKLARQAAAFHKLDPALVCAICEQESAWNPFATRFEPAFFAKYVAPLYTNNKVSASEAYARSFSWGLMQLMGETARELGFANTYLASLCDPATGLDWGCLQFSKKLSLAGGDTQQALLLWNGGKNAVYPSQVLARIPKYNAETVPSNHDTVQIATSGEA